VNDPKIRVLVVGHAYVVSGAFQKKLVALAETGKVEIGLLVPKSWKSRQWGRTFHFERLSNSVRVYEVPAALKGCEGAYLLEPISVLRAIASFKPHVIQIEQEVFALSSFELALLRLIHRRDLIFFGWENIDRPRRLGLLRRTTRYVVLNSAAAVTCGNRDNQTLIRKWGYKGPTWVIPQFGVDTHSFSPECRRKALEFTFAFAGALTHQKGVDVLLKALMALRKEGHGFKLVICGVGPLEKDLMRIVDQSGLSNLVSWRGMVAPSEMPETLAGVDVLVLPSRTMPLLKEQFGLVLVEAMAMGIPVVGSDSGGIPDVIGRSDLVFREEDVSSLAHILERLMKEEAFRQEASQYGIKRVERYYTNERIADQLLEIYRRALHVDPGFEEPCIERFNETTSISEPR